MQVNWWKWMEKSRKWGWRLRNDPHLQAESMGFEGLGQTGGDGLEGPVKWLLWKCLEGSHNLRLLHHVQLVFGRHFLPKLGRVVHAHFPERLQQVSFLARESATGKAFTFCMHID